MFIDSLNSTKTYWAPSLCLGLLNIKAKTDFNNRPNSCLGKV